MYSKLIDKMTSIIKEGINKKFWCKLGFHKWGRWRGINIYSSNVIDRERRCRKCGKVVRKTEEK